MRFRTLALALALCCGAGTMVQAATNPQAKAARKRAKQNRKALAKRVKHGRSTQVKAKRTKTRKG
jgi:hypothetical protein